MEDIVDTDVTDELSGTSADGETGEFGTVSPPSPFDDGVTVSELTEDLRVVGLIADGKGTDREGSRGLFARGVEVPDCGGVTVETSLLLEMPFETSTSSELTLSLLRVFCFGFKAAGNAAALLGCRHEFEAFGLGPGDDFGDTPGEFRGDDLAEDDRDPEGERRGEGRGNNSLSSSSAIGEALRGRWCAGV